ncbi:MULTISPECIES: hypothetical protein [unclassified Streptomyces]|uniref:hypothetical protein n=1 Tax=unclassified Streptomyces TaxID=2593676 RepID=UPI0016619E61|nr:MULTISPECIES: hypothetical protein [unclassified Streptomyces]MBD0843407.1 hypothetical protein [Streptomyces sp. TRM68416]
MGSDAHACPVCGQSVETVVRRHKTLGAWVPRWVAGPCRNPDCEAYVEEGSEEECRDPHHHHGHHPRHKHPDHHERAEDRGEPEGPGEPAEKNS